MTYEFTEFDHDVQTPNGETARAVVTVETNEEIVQKSHEAVEEILRDTIDAQLEKNDGWVTEEYLDTLAGRVELTCDFIYQIHIELEDA